MSGAHRIIFQAIKDAKAKCAVLNLEILTHELEKRGQLDEAGGLAYVAELTNVDMTANVGFYESDVLRAYVDFATWKIAVTAREAIDNRQDSLAVRAWMYEELDKVAIRTVTGEGGILFSDLLKKRFPPEDFLVEGLITTGLTVLTGASKIGKSWAALQLVTALDRGGCFLGTLKAQKCDVLYCALEDTPKRIQKRLQKQGVGVFNGSRLETKRRNPADLRAFLKANPQFRVVIIDTFQKMMGISDLNDYSQTVNDMSALKDIADSLNIAVIVIHHNRKGADLDGDHIDSALGSTGINATADTTLTMRWKRGAAEATLSVTGRDVEDTAYTLSWDSYICSWSVTGQGALKPALTDAQQRIIDLLESETRNWTTGEIAERLGKSSQTISEQATKVAMSGLIDKPAYGQWRAKGSFGVSNSLRETETPKVADTSETAPEAPAVPVNVPEEAALW
jgi:hypothetical protein